MKALKYQGIKKSFFKGMVALFIGALCVSAYGQSQDLIGEWELAGRMCEDNKNFIPPNEDVLTFIFRSNNSFQISFFRAPDTGGLTEEEVEEEREKIRAEFRAMQERDEESHESACKESQVIGENEEDLCAAQAKRKLYDKWWSSRQKERDRGDCISCS